MNADLEARIEATTRRLELSAQEVVKQRAGETITGDGRVSEVVAARLLGRHPDTLRKMREVGEGPIFYRPDGRVSYRLYDLAHFIEIARITPADQANVTARESCLDGLVRRERRSGHAD